MPIDFVEESAPKIDFVPDEQEPSLDRELEREDLRRQMREARAEAYGNKAILGLADLGERAAYTASLMDPLTAVGRVINPRQQSAIPAEAAQAAIDFFDPFGNAPVGSAREGAKQFGAELVSGLAQPEAAAAMMTGKINPQLPGRLFQPGLIKGSQQAAANLAQAETPSEAVKSGLELGLAVGGTAGIEAHGEKAGKAKPTDLKEAAITEPIPKPEVAEAKSVTVKDIALEEQAKAGWKKEWPFVPADFGNKTFREALESDPTLSAAEKDQMFTAAEKLLGTKIERPKPAEPAPVEAAAPVAETAKTAEVETKAKPVDVSQVESVPATENGGRIAIILPDGTAIVGGRIHADTWNRAVDQGVATDATLADGYAGFVKPDGTAWGVNGKPLPKVSKVVIVGSEQPKPPALLSQRPTPPPPSPEAQAKPAAPAEVKTEVKVKQPWDDTPVDEMFAAPLWTEKYRGMTQAIRDLRERTKDNPVAAIPLPAQKLLTAAEKQDLLAHGFTWTVDRMGNPLLKISQAAKSDTLRRTVMEKAAQNQPPPQPSAGIEVKKQGEEGVNVESAKQKFSEASQKLAKARLTYIIGEPREKFANAPASKRKIMQQYWDAQDALKKAEQTPPTPGPGAQTVGETQPPQIQGMGGATPAEFVKGQGSPTAMKYRLIDQERQKRGLEPLSKPDRISDQKTMDKAIAAMDQNPNLPDQLIQELRAKPRAIEDWENHVLLLRKIELREEYHKAAREAMQAYADSAQFPERLADMEAANARTQFYSEKLTELEEASRVAGSARGRALRALRVMANEDFSLASLEMEKRAANNWREITPDERAELIKIADEHKAKSEELQKRLDELEKAQQDKEVGTVLTNLKAEVKRNPVAPTSIDLISGKIRGKLEKDPKADIRFYVRKIARFFVSQGTKERDVLVDQVHGVLSGIIPDLDRRTTMDLISGYGDYSRLPKDTVSVILRDLSGQMQQIAKLEDMMRGEAPLRSGQERRTPSDVERILQKQVEEQKKKGGYTVTDPETQLRTAQEAVQKRLQNQITDLELQIQTRQKIIKNPTKLQYDAKSNQLKARRDELKAVYDEIFAKPAKTEAERLAEWKERTKDRIDELKEFLAGTKQPKQKPTPVVLDKEALRIRFDLHTIERLWREKLAKEKRDQWTRWQKAKTIPAEVLNVSRALLTSFDFSAPGRQGIIIGLAHPLRAASALKPMFEAWRSEKGAFDAAEQIRNRNNAPLYEIGKLYLAEHGGRLSRQEEAYMSRWAAKIPGIRASERAYVTFLNRLRADSFDSMVEGLTANGTANPAELKAIANFINVATGRGVGLEKSGTTLNTVFFAPRYVFSRFQFLAGQPLYKGTAATRKAIAKEYGKFLAGAAVVYALASSAGADVGTDPRSSDFGKIIIGNTRIDPMAGLNQVSTLVGRIVSGETKPLKGRPYPIVGKVPYGKSNLLDVMMNFGRGKLSPAIGTGISLRLGRDVANQPFGVSDLPKSMGVPISWQDMYSAMREEGVPAGIAMGMLSMFGIGVNTYEQQNRR